jgi:cytochrome P450
MDTVKSAQAQSNGCPAHGRSGTVDKDATFLDPAILARPNAFYRALRQQDPVHYDPKLDMYLVSRFEDLQTVVRDPQTFSVKHGYEEQYAKGFAEEFNEILARDGGGVFPDIIMTDPPAHTRPRRLMEKAFTAHRVQTLEPRMSAIVVEQIEQMARRLASNGVADGVKDFAAPVTIKMICDQLGFDQFDIDKIQRWSIAATSTISRMGTREELLAHAKEMSELQLYLIDHVKKRQQARTEDLLSDLVYAEIDDPDRPTLTFEEVVALSRPMLVAGNETTATALGNLLLLLATEPAIVESLREAADDERLMNRFVEELLRLEPPVRGLSRMTTREVELGGVKLPAHAHLLLLFASANDDETEFACPRAFDMNRPNLGRHVAFSAGVHRCIGAPLARMEIRVAARELIKRLDKIQLQIPIEEISYLPTVATHSIANLPISFTLRP